MRLTFLLSLQSLLYQPVCRKLEVCERQTCAKQECQKSGIFKVCVAALRTHVRDLSR